MIKDSLLKMAGIPLEEEPRKILEPRRIEDREEKRKQVEYKRLVELINQTGGHIDRLDLYNSKLTELPEGIISVKSLFLEGSSVQKLPNSLKEVDRLFLEFADIVELPEGLNVKLLDAGHCEFLKKIPSYRTLKVLSIFETEVEEIGEYPQLEQLHCGKTPFLEKAKQEAKSQGIDVKKYIKQKHKLPQDCSIVV